MAGAARLSSAARVLFLLAVVSCAVWAAPAAATRSQRSGRAAPASRVVLGGSFQQMKGVGAGGVVASGDYLLLSTTVSGGFGTGWTVINQRVGTTTALDPQCQFVGLGPPWVLMSCPQASNPGGPFDAVLYSLMDGTRQTVTPSPGLPLGCGQGPTWRRNAHPRSPSGLTGSNGTRRVTTAPSPRFSRTSRRVSSGTTRRTPRLSQT